MYYIIHINLNYIFKINKNIFQIENKLCTILRPFLSIFWMPSSTYILSKYNVIILFIQNLILIFYHHIPEFCSVFSWQKVKAKVTQLCLLFVNPWIIQYIEFSRPEYWSGYSFSSPGESSQPRDWTQVSSTAGRFSTSWTQLTGE